MSLDKNKKILILGHKGMVGSAIYRNLVADGYNNIHTLCRNDLNLSHQSDVKAFFRTNWFDKVFLCAAKVGGIHSNSQYPAEFIYENLIIQTNVISSCHENDIDNLIFLGSSCIYPKEAEQPIKEEELLNGPLEITNQWYAIAKIAGIKLCESFNIQHNRDYRSIMPTNLYGPNDNYHPENSHVIPSLIRKFYEAIKNNYDSVEIWGTGSPLREFLHVDDMADAAIHISNIEKNKFLSFINKDLSHINVGTGKDISIYDLAKLIKNISNYEGEIYFNSNKPDGTIRKVLNTSKLTTLGWTPKISLENGIKEAYEWFDKNYPNVRGS